MNPLRRLALLAAPDLRDVARRVEEADRLLGRGLLVIRDTDGEEDLRRARSILDGIHHDLMGRGLHNRG